MTIPDAHPGTFPCITAGNRARQRHSDRLSQRRDSRLLKRPLRRVLPLRPHIFIDRLFVSHPCEFALPKHRNRYLGRIGVGRGKTRATGLAPINLLSGCGLCPLEAATTSATHSCPQNSASRMLARTSHRLRPHIPTTRCSRAQEGCAPRALGCSGSPRH